MNIANLSIFIIFIISKKQNSLNYIMYLSPGASPSYEKEGISRVWASTTTIGSDETAWIPASGLIFCGLGKSKFFDILISAKLTCHKKRTKSKLFYFRVQY